MHGPYPPTAPLTRSQDQYQSIASLADISQLTPKFREIVPPSHRQGNCIPFAAFRWHDFGNRPALVKPFGHFSRHPDTPLLSCSSRCRFPRPTPERVFVAIHRSAAGFPETAFGAPLLGISGHNRDGGFPWLSPALALEDDPMLVDGAPALRCPASLRRAHLAENHGKPSLWVFITDPWY